ncbi:unnamed protein product [Adineta steineri]|uniref:Uncharacterized protein n=1 Tax=Adineta steineri TaxID=433720 RepID=A0A815VM78_9BILA|nr:unnamed protein product [Adineta steineri]
MMDSSSNDSYCELCSSKNEKKCFSCDHCHLLMCYDCFQKHTNQLIEEYSQLRKRFLQLTNLINNKRELLVTFEDYCIRNVNSVFDEVLNDLQSFRNESIDYVKQHFQDAKIIISDMITNIKPLTIKFEQESIHDNKNIKFDFDNQHKQINIIEDCLALFSSPNMKLKMFTYPRNKLDLHCQLLLNSCTTINTFSPSSLDKLISAQCLYSQSNENENKKIIVDTEIEEFSQNIYTTKQIQTDSMVESNCNTDNDEDDEFFSLQDELSSEHYLSTRYVCQGTILTHNEVDRIASDGEHLLYFSDEAKLLCYVTNISSDKQVNEISITKEITCRWPHYPILDLVYSPSSSQFVCATRKGLYTCAVDSNNDDSTIDIQMQLTQHWSYVRLSADKNFLWLWTDTPRLSQLHVYSPKTFHCIKIFNLNDYQCFSNNSTSFCIQKNVIATVFQFKQMINTTVYKKNFHITFCDSTDLHELCTIRLGECDIDHEIRANNDGIFFLTNGKNLLWIVDRHGKKEYVKLYRTGRALTIHGTNQILIANGTHQLQCVENLQNVYRNI